MHSNIKNVFATIVERIRTLRHIDLVQMFRCQAASTLLFGAITIFLAAQWSSIQHLPSAAFHERRAFATYFSPGIIRGRNSDLEFDAVRNLVYQVLHQPSTRTRQNTSMLVLISPDVSDQQRKLLEIEGAEIVTIQPSSIHRATNNADSQDSLIALRLLELTQYDRILFLQPYLLLTKTLDMIWEEHAASRVQLTRKNSHVNQSREVSAPENYLFASVPSRHGKTFSSGFWVVQPDRQLYRYYISLMKLDDGTDNQSAELHGILNHAHRKEGNMPWTQLSSAKWHSDVSTRQDLLPDCATVYNNFWLLHNPSSVNKGFMDLWWKTQGYMKAYWKERSQTSKL